MVKKMDNKKVVVINDYCQQRIKPKLTRDVKTEAILVFARTALERFFHILDNSNANLVLKDINDTDFVYSTLRELLKDLQYYVVNVEYLLELGQYSKKYPRSVEFKNLVKYEEPLMEYYDAMAKRVKYHFPKKTTALPEFIVICVLCNWFLENEKPMNMYPFLEKYDFIELIEKFELYANHTNQGEKKLLSITQSISIDIVEALKRKKYKANKEISAKRKKRR